MALYNLTLLGQKEKESGLLLSDCGECDITGLAEGTGGRAAVKGRNTYTLLRIQ